MVSIKVIIALQTDNMKKVLTFGESNISDFYTSLFPLLENDETVHTHYKDWESASEILECIQEKVEVKLAENEKLNV